MKPSSSGNINSTEGGYFMSKSKSNKRNYEHFVPNHIGTQPRGFGGNKGKKMQSNTGGVPQVMQTKGE